MRGTDESGDSAGQRGTARRSAAPTETRCGRTNPRRGGRSALTDSRALAIEYLKQQRLLGGDSVILSDSQTVGQSDGDNSTPAVPSDRPTVRPSEALPSPGLSFEPASVDLFAA